jgi:hypothetical protein
MSKIGTLSLGNNRRTPRRFSEGKIKFLSKFDKEKTFEKMLGTKCR